MKDIILYLTMAVVAIVVIFYLVKYTTSTENNSVKDSPYDYKLCVTTANNEYQQCLKTADSNCYKKYMQNLLPCIQELNFMNPCVARCYQQNTKCLKTHDRDVCFNEFNNCVISNPLCWN
jgi:hypothetical protein